MRSQDSCDVHCIHRRNRTARTQVQVVSVSSAVNFVRGQIVLTSLLITQDFSSDFSGFIVGLKLNFC